MVSLFCLLIMYTADISHWGILDNIFLKNTHSKMIKYEAKLFKRHQML